MIYKSTQKKKREKTRIQQQTNTEWKNKPSEYEHIKNYQTKQRLQYNNEGDFLEY